MKLFIARIMGLTTIGWPSVYATAAAGGKNQLSRIQKVWLWGEGPMETPEYRWRPLFNAAKFG